MAPTRPKIFIVLLAISSALFCVAATAQSVYVIDTIPVPIRSENCSDCRILQWGIKAGLELEVIAADGDWTHVTTPGGVEGWIETQYITEQQTLNESEQGYLNQIDTLNSRYNALADQVSRLIQETGNENIQLDASQLDDPALLTEQMEQLIQSATDAMNLGSKNADLLERNQTLQYELDLTNAENSRLREDTGRKWFAYGAFAVTAGVIVGLIMPMFRRRKKAYSEWS